MNKNHSSLKILYIKSKLNNSTAAVFFSFMLAILFTSFTLNKSFAQETLDSKFEHLEPVLLGTDGIASIAVEGNTLFTASYSNGLFVFDISDPFYPKVKGRTVELNIPTSGLVVKENYLYVSDNVGGFLLFDISDPEQIKLIQKYRTKSSEAWDLKLDPSKNILYVAAGKVGVELWNVSQPKNPKYITTLGESKNWDFAWGLSISNQKLYVSDKSNGVKVFDIQEASSPKEILSYKTDYQNHYTLANDSLLFLANGPGGFEIVNLNTSPKPKAIFKQSYKAQFVTGLAFYEKNPDFLFVGTGKSGVYIYHIPSILNKANNPLVNKDQRIQEFNRIAQLGHSFYIASNRGIHIYNFDVAPIFTDVESQTIDEKQNLKYTFKGYDPDGSPTKIDLIPIDAKPVSLIYNKSNQLVTWLPSYEESGIYNFIARITEESPDNLFAERNFSITVNHVNRTPSLPKPANQLVEENKLLEYVIPKGSDPDKEDQGKLVYIAENLPKGAAFNPADRKFTWTPEYDQAGSYKIDMIIKDSNSDGKGALSNKQVLEVRVDNINRAPKLDRMQTLSFSEDNTSSYTITASDPDKEDKEKLKFTATKLPKGARFDPSTQAFSWTPDFEQAGSYTAKFKVEDQGLNSLLFPNPALVLNDTMTVSIEVKQTNRKPIFVQTPGQSIKENNKLEFSVIATDPDKEDKGKLVYSALSLPLGATFNPEKLTLTWTPTFDQSGKYDVTFVTTDTGIDGIKLTDSLRVLIDVVNVNRRPSIEKVANLEGKENSPITLPLNVFDPDKEDKGKLVITGQNMPKGAAINGQSMVWTPDFEQAGSYKITYFVTDVEGMKDSTTHTISVGQTNRAPKFAAITPQTVQENATLTFKISADDPDQEDQGKLSYKASSLPSGAIFDSTYKTCSWKPAFTQSGTYSATFQVDDIGIDGKVLSDYLTVPITVKNVNRVPSIVAISDTTVSENSLISFIIGISDPDIEDDGKLVVSCNKLPQGASLKGQSFSWKPSYEQSGSYTLTFTVKDLEGLTDKFTHTITVTNTNRAPAIVKPNRIEESENEEIKYKVNVSDPDKEDKGLLETTVEGLPEGASFEKNTLTWKPNFDQSGLYNLTYTVKDKDGLTASTTQEIVVKHVNRKPKIKINAGKEVKVLVNKSLAFNVSVSDPDKEDQDKLRLTCTSELPKGASFNASTGEFSWTPSAQQNGGYSFEFKVTDSANESAYAEIDVRVSEESAQSNAAK